MKPGDGLYDHEDVTEIRELLLGRTVKKVAEDSLLLDDGTFVRLVGNDGGCACSAGCYDLTELNEVPNIITNVEVQSDPAGDGYGDAEGVYRIFVYAENRKINLATFEGSDGNGYYGTGFHLTVRRGEAA